MARGGFRPGAGRPKGSGNKPKPTAKKAAGRKPSKSRDAAPSARSEPEAARDPLTYMLDVLNDPDASAERRDRMAIAAAPFVHGKVGEAGKKGAKATAATAAVGGRFAPAQPPPAARVN